MTDLQTKEYELLKCFIEICEKLNLQYFLVCGSALGAVKYKGFIPWDDDVDVGMMRGDYDIFIKEATKFLPEKYFLQNYMTDKLYPAIYSKLRDSSTTYIEKSSAELKINHGIFIDIFPLDGYPESKAKRIIFEFKKKIYSCMLNTAYDIPRKALLRIANVFFKCLGCHKKTAIISEKYTNMISKYNTEDSFLICNHGNWQGKLEYAEKTQYGEGFITEFEGLEVRIPINYDEYLTQKYGDWRADLPLEERIGHHFFVECNTKKSYLK